MPFIEAPTNFYLGRHYDPASKTRLPEVAYYDSRHLTTHAIVVGMTGSGKTGLCISMLEEAILDNIPAIIIDPKGDIANLMLAFPDMKPVDFEPWVNIDDAQRANMDIPEFARLTADKWRKGLQDWGIPPERLSWLKHAGRVSVFTPGSEAGLPVSILASLKAPKDGWADHEEEYREEISGIVTALLGLIGRSAQPVQDKEHVLISNIFEYAWSHGNDLTLQDLVMQVQKPPFEKLGVFGVDEYLSVRNRGKLAGDLNNILASPSFQSWMTGAPLDIQSFLYTPDGQPKVSIFYLAHLTEPERQFVMTLLLETMTVWMRQLSGTTSLRALLYIDEMFGYFPPYPFNPPTKTPLLRMLKQARAFGVGLILATQNPGDLDYKGLSNTGTWFIGRLSTDNDRQRLMAGLQSMNSAMDENNLKVLNALIADLDPRTFLLSDVHDPESPYVFQTRWAMSYLRGPLTRQQVGMLMADQKVTMRQELGTVAFRPAAPTYSVAPGRTYGSQVAGFRSVAPPPQPSDLPAPPPALPEMPAEIAPPAPQWAPPPEAPPTYTPQQAAPPTPPPQTMLAQAQPSQPAAPRQRSGGYSGQRPSLSADIPQYFLPHSVAAAQALGQWQAQTGFFAQAAETAPAYRPVLMAQAAVRFSDRKSNTYTVRLFAYQIPELDRTGLLHWNDYATAPVDTRAVSADPLTSGLFGSVPASLSDPKRLVALKREMVDMLYSTARIAIPFSRELGIYGSPDGDINAFRGQVQQAAREARDAALDALTRKYETQFDAFNDKMRRFDTRVRAQQAELATNKRMKTLTTGEAILGLMQGRTAFTLSRMNMAEYWKQRTEGDLNMNQLQKQQMQEEIDELQERFQADCDALNQKWAQVAVTIDEQPVTPYKKDIAVELFGIGWQPYWYTEAGGQAVLLAGF